MPPAGMATHTAHVGSHRVLSLPLPTFAGPARGPRAARAAVVAAVLAGLAGALAVAGTAGWLGRLLIVAGLATGWALGRRNAPGRREWAELEAELQSQTRDLRESRARPAHGGCRTAPDRARSPRRMPQRLIALRIKLGLAEELVDVKNKGALRSSRSSRRTRRPPWKISTRSSAAPTRCSVDRGLADALKGLARSAPMPVRVHARAARATRPRWRRPSTSPAPRRCRTPRSTPAGWPAPESPCGTMDPGPRLRSGTTDRDSAMTSGPAPGSPTWTDRVGAVGGRLRVTSAPGRGTAV